MIIKSILSMKSLKPFINYNQIRTVIILKRKVRPIYMQSMKSPFIVGPFFNDFQLRQEPREPADFIYDVVEDTNTRKYGKMKVILLQHVEELGVPGDIVEVNIPYGRFQLISAKKADYYCDYNLKKYKDLIESGAEHRVGPSSAFVMTTVRRLAKEVVLVEMNNKKEWIIQKRHLRIALRKAGYVVPEDNIELPKTPISGPDITHKEAKDFAVHITINGRERVPVRCMIHHLEQPLSPNWFKTPRFILLPEEQKQLLNEMPVQQRLEDEDLESEDNIY